MKYVEVLYHQKSWDINRNVSGNYWGLTGCIPQNVHVLCWEHYDQPVPYSQTNPVAQWPGPVISELQISPGFYPSDVLCIT